MGFHLRSSLPLFAASLLIACSSSETQPPSPAVVQATKSTNVGSSGAHVLVGLERFGPIQQALLRRSPIELRADGFVRTKVPTSAALSEATLPRTIDAPIHLVSNLADGAWANVRNLDVESTPGALHDNAVVFEQVAPSTDVVMTAEAVRVEETRLLKDEKAPTTFRYRVDLGPAIVDAHVRAGMVELADATGYTHLSTDVAYAVDAKGVKRQLTVALEGTGATRTMVASLDTKGLEFPIAVDPVWTSMPSQPGGPNSNNAISLNSGKVMVVGGYSPYTCIFNPATNTWTGGSAGGVDNVPLTHDDTSGPTITSFIKAIKLASGKVLVLAGGKSDRGAAIFDETTLKYTTTGMQVTVCDDCDIALLPSGNVFKVTHDGLGHTELYNPSTGVWTAQANAPITSGSEIHVAALQGAYAGRVFAFGGTPAQNAAVWNSATNTWTASVLARRFNTPRVIPLADGRAFVGGQPTGTGISPAVAITFNPATNTSTDTSISPVAILGVNFQLLSSGLVLAAGGEFAGSPPPTSSTSAIYDPTADTWTTIDALAMGQTRTTMVEMTNKSVLLIGGFGPFNATSPTGDAQRYTPLAQGTACGTAALKAVTCVTGYCVNSTCCSTATCPSGVCNAPAVAGRAAGVCALNNGQACTAASQCASGTCVDGVCCNVACTGQCEACNLAGTAGTCTPVTGAPKAPRAACSGVGAGTACGPTCDGTVRTSCSYGAAGTVACGTAACTAGTMTTASKCDGKGVCPSTSSSCGAYSCGPTACLTTCTNDSFCAAGYYCDLPSSTCVPKTGLGIPCTGPSVCSAGTFCTDGVCCGVATCGTGSSCGLGTTGGPILPGTCSKVNGTTCGSDAECGSNHCTDGVCCNTSCTDQCAACDVPTKVGTCSPVLGKPHGTKKTACDDGGTNKCGAKQCDGTSATSACNGFVNDGTVSCAVATCTGSTLLPAAVCDGAGACTKPTSSSCGKYTCDPVALKCRTSCATDTDCANEAKCREGKCTDASTCSTDNTQSIDPVTKTPTDCAPYICASGTCNKSCTASSDCQPGFTCDTSSGSGLCVTQTGDAGSSGGCAVNPADDDHQSWGGVALGVVACVMLLGRKKRARRG